MALVTLDGAPLLEAVISQPRQGVWLVRATMDAQAAPAAGARVTIDVAGEVQLVGTVTPRAGLDRGGFVQLVVLGGAGRLATDAAPKWYHPADVPGGLRLRIVLADLLQTVGEQLDAGADRAVLDTALAGWTTWAQPTGTMLDALVMAAPAGNVWRITPAGKLWVGADTWAVVQLPDVVVVEDNPREGKIVLAVESPTLAPGVALDLDALGIAWGSGRVSYAEHRMGQEAVRTTVWTEL